MSRFLKYLPAVAAAGLLGAIIARADYNVTQPTTGTLTPFGSVVVSTVHYAQQLICDYVTPSQCAHVSAGGALSVAGPVTVASGGIASGAVASGAYASGSYASGSIGSGAMVDLGAIADAAATAGSTGSVSAKLRLVTGTIGTAGSPATNMVTVQNVGGEYPTGAVTSQDSDTGTTAATASSLPAVSSYTQYVCGFSIRANATAAATGNSTLSDGTITLNFTQWTAPLASGIGLTEMIFSPCKPASATNTAWTLTSAAPGSGGVVSTAIWGYRVP